MSEEKPFNPAPPRFDWRWLPVHAVVLSILFLAEEQLMNPLSDFLGAFDNLLLDFSRQFGEVQTVLVASALLYCFRSRRKRMVPMMIVAVAAAGLAMTIAKPIAGRGRPNETNSVTHFRPIELSERLSEEQWEQLQEKNPYEEMDLERIPLPLTGRELIALESPSLPSGHATAAMANATTLSYVLPEGRWVFLTLAIACGFHRIEDGKHFPSDVYLGFLFGHYISLGVISLFRRKRASGELQ